MPSEHLQSLLIPVTKKISMQKKKKKKAKFFFPLKRRHFQPEENTEAKARERKERNDAHVVHSGFPRPLRGQGRMGSQVHDQIETNASSPLFLAHSASSLRP